MKKIDVAVVRPNAAKIDFSGFKPILSGIDGAIQHYATTKAAVANAEPISAEAAASVI